MEPIRSIAVNQPQSNASVSLTTRSGPPLPAGMGMALATLMAQTQARYPNQTLPEGTPDMYLVEWEEIALKYGLAMFQAGLSRVLRNSRFFPDPLDIREACWGLRNAEIRQAETDRELAARKAYAEDVAAHPENYVTMGDLMREFEARRTAVKA